MSIKRDFCCIILIMGKVQKENLSPVIENAEQQQNTDV